MSKHDAEKMERQLGGWGDTPPSTAWSVGYDDGHSDGYRQGARTWGIAALLIAAFLLATLAYVTWGCP